MRELFSVIDIALSFVSKSLAEITPQNLDNCISGFRFIVEFSGTGEEVTLTAAEILGPDWELLPGASREFTRKVSLMVENRNTEYRQLIRQTGQIREDRAY